MKIALASTLALVTFGPCSRDPAPPAAPPAPAAPAPPVAAPTPPPAPPAPALPLPAGVWPGADALAVSVADPPTLIVQRAATGVSLRLGSVSCSLAAAPGAGGFGPATTCTWQAGGCRGTLRAERMMVIGGSGSRLVVETETATGEQSGDCAALAGTFEERHGGPVPARIPPVPNAACLTGPMRFSHDGAACLSPVDGRTLQSYVGACCVGRAARRFTVDEGAATRLVSPDGLTVVTARGLTIAADQVAANAPVLSAYRDGPARSLRVNDLLAGDPVLTAGVGFSIDVRVDNGALVVSPIGGISHTVPLAP